MQYNNLLEEKRALEENLKWIEVRRQELEAFHVLKHFIVVSFLQAFTCSTSEKIFVVIQQSKKLIKAQRKWFKHY